MTSLLRRLFCAMGFHRPSVHVAGPIIRASCTHCAWQGKSLQFTGRGWIAGPKPGETPWFYLSPEEQRTRFDAMRAS